MITRPNAKKDQREYAKEYIAQKTSIGSVIDIGGVMNPWAGELITHFVDMNTPKSYLKDNYPEVYENVKSAEVFKMDVCSAETWDYLISYVEVHGKFDFAICTHVLEDIRNPEIVVSGLSKIAKEGFVSVPSTHWELGHVECITAEDMIVWSVKRPFRGFYHHRWILTIREGILVVVPKLTIINSLDLPEVDMKETFHEMSFFWKEHIPFTFYNNDFIGPFGPDYCKEYIKFLDFIGDEYTKIES